MCIQIKVVCGDPDTLNWLVFENFVKLVGVFSYFSFLPDLCFSKVTFQHLMITEKCTDLVAEV